MCAVYCRWKRKKRSKWHLTQHRWLHSLHIQHFPVLRLLCQSREGTWRSVGKHYSLGSCTADRVTGFYFLKHKQRIGIGKWPVFCVTSMRAPNYHRTLHRPSLWLLEVPHNKTTFQKACSFIACRKGGRVGPLATITAHTQKKQNRSPFKNINAILTIPVNLNECFNLKIKVGTKSKKMALVNREKQAKNIPASLTLTSRTLVVTAKLPGPP